MNEKNKKILGALIVFLLFWVVDITAENHSVVNGFKVSLDKKFQPVPPQGFLKFVFSTPQDSNVVRSISIGHVSNKLEAEGSSINIESFEQLYSIYKEPMLEVIKDTIKKVDTNFQTQEHLWKISTVYRKELFMSMAGTPTKDGALLVIFSYLDIPKEIDTEKAEAEFKSILQTITKE